jgi:hypothetical protein
MQNQNRAKIGKRLLEILAQFGILQASKNPCQI